MVPHYNKIFSVSLYGPLPLVYLLSLSLWSAASGLAFNVKKCKLQSITRKSEPINLSYEVNGHTIQSCEEERDLGVLVDCDLTWRAQFCYQGADANKLPGTFEVLLQGAPCILAFCVRNSGLGTSSNRTNFLTWKNSKTCNQIYSSITFYHRSIL